jgi:hypothetical protein
MTHYLSLARLHQSMKLTDVLESISELNNMGLHFDVEFDLINEVSDVAPSSISTCWIKYSPTLLIFVQTHPVVTDKSFAESFIFVKGPDRQNHKLMEYTLEPIQHPTVNHLVEHIQRIYRIASRPHI